MFGLEHGLIEHVPGRLETQPRQQVVVENADDDGSGKENVVEDRIEDGEYSAHVQREHEYEREHTHDHVGLETQSDQLVCPCFEWILIAF